MKVYYEWEQGFPNWLPNRDVIKRNSRKDYTEQLTRDIEELAEKRGQA